MKTISYTVLHYGKSYLGAAIQSVIDRVDEVWILYTPKPSHGHANEGGINPDTRDELRAIAEKAAGAKLRWHEGEYSYEGQHREKIYELAPDADMIYVLDSDELWTDKVFNLIDAEAGYQGAHITIPFIHFYRSFRRAILHDPAAPPRVLFPKAVRKDWHLSANLETPLMHMGYCQPATTIRYKLGIHGHKNELRMSADDYTDKIYLDLNRWNDVHPVGSEFWNAEQVSPLDYLPAFMREHPFYELENVI